MRSSLACLVMLMLAACQTTTSGSSTASAPSNVVATKPGARPLDAMVSTSLFRSICVATYPNLPKAKQALAELGFAQNPTTGTYYDGKRDVSFKLGSGQSGKSCSMVFSSKEEPSELAIAFSVASTVGDKNGSANVLVHPQGKFAETKSVGGSSMRFQHRGRINNKSYFNASLVGVK
ncbi:hypothetical protein [Phaeobacter inhibens]|uniref:hypothetical protein n=1 Tax=Phaeobacter inhibens TaxID=221822 RepID=UPI0021A4528E|nr:hypothetical protein [Phaeobacter inhibens]UWR45530.1 hypothetical protein K4F86_01770 [Phaeobacter inhibens]